jgi:hypothetical protein
VAEGGAEGRALEEAGGGVAGEPVVSYGFYRAERKAVQT